MLLSAGCVPTETGVHAALTVTVNVKVVPGQVPEYGVTV
jgi:hypothetical protein